MPIQPTWILFDESYVQRMHWSLIRISVAVVAPISLIAAIAAPVPHGLSRAQFLGMTTFAIVALPILLHFISRLKQRTYGLFVTPESMLLDFHHVQSLPLVQNEAGAPEVSIVTDGRHYTITSGGRRKKIRLPIEAIPALPEILVSIGITVKQLKS